MFLLPVSITVIQSFILMGPGNLCFCEPNTQSRQCLRITDQWVHLFFGFFVNKTFFYFIFTMEITFIIPWDEGDMSEWYFSDGSAT